MEQNLRCLCDSGRPALACCLSAKGHWYKLPVKCTPSGPNTGYAHPQCYGHQSSVQNCCKKISREHLFPHSILKLQADNGMNRIFGVGQNPDSVTALPSLSVVAKVLCKRHNAALSTIDNQGKRFFATLLRFALEFNSTDQAIRSEVKLFNGEDIERFIIKLACTFVKSGTARRIPNQHALPLPDEWIATLFEGSSIPAEHGMRLLIPPGQQLTYDGGLGIMPWLSNPLDPRTLGVTVTLGGFAFWQSPIAGIKPTIIQFPNHDPHEEFPVQPRLNWSALWNSRREVESYLRPDSISFRSGDVTKSILFSWQDQIDHFPVNLWRESIE